MTGFGLTPNLEDSVDIEVCIRRALWDRGLQHYAVLDRLVRPAAMNAKAVSDF